MVIKNKSTHGGARKGSGPRLKYGEPLKMISIKVPVSKISEVKDLIKEKLKTYQVAK